MSEEVGNLAAVQPSTSELSEPVINKPENVEQKKSIKKKRVHNVQSRYMQQAQESSMQRRLTPTSGNKKKTALVTSTPSVATSTAATLTDCNVSAITGGAARDVRRPVFKKSLESLRRPAREVGVASTVLEVSKIEVRSSTPIPSVRESEPVLVPVTSSSESPELLELLHSRKVLAAYLLEKEKTEEKARVQETLTDLWALSRMNNDMIQENTALSKQLQEEKDLLRLYKNLTAQKILLDQILPQVPVMKDCIGSIMESVDAACSEIPVKNIILPSDQGDLIPELKSLISTLESILIDCQPVGTELHKLASIFPSLISTLKSSEDVVQRTEDQSKNLIQLVSKEISLLIQRYQEGILIPKQLENLRTNFRN